MRDEQARYLGWGKAIDEFFVVSSRCLGNGSKNTFTSIDQVRQFIDDHSTSGPESKGIRAWCAGSKCSHVGLYANWREPSRWPGIHQQFFSSKSMHWFAVCFFHKLRYASPSIRLIYALIVGIAVSFS